jgi:glycopeptide antibiotics resistance protein
MLCVAMVGYCALKIESYGGEILSKKLMSKSFKFLTWFLFVLYFVVLVNVIILKDGTALAMARYRTEVSLSQKISGINFIPLRTIIPYLEGKPSVYVAMENLLGNIFAFSPLGFLLPLLFKKCSKIKNTFLISTGISLFIEVIQVIFYLGSCDLDDLILNVLGSLIGFGIYRLFIYFTRRNVQVVS